MYARISPQVVFGRVMLLHTHNQRGNDTLWRADFVCSVVAEDMRAIDGVTQNRPDGTLVQRHEIRIDPVPIDDNDAHAEIYPHPRVATKGVFRKLQERLARLACWEGGYGPED